MGGFGWEGGGPGGSGGKGKGVARGGCTRGVGLRWEVLGERSCWWEVLGGSSVEGLWWEGEKGV